MSGWRTQAACLGYPTEWWFEVDGRSPTRREALLICNECSVAHPCGEEALAEEADFTFRQFVGIRGGLTADARRKLLRDRSRDKSASFHVKPQVSAQKSPLSRLDTVYLSTSPVWENGRAREAATSPALVIAPTEGTR